MAVVRRRPRPETTPEPPAKSTEAAKEKQAPAPEPTPPETRDDLADAPAEVEAPAVTKGKKATPPSN